VLLEQRRQEVHAFQTEFRGAALRNAQPAHDRPHKQADTPTIPEQNVSRRVQVVFGQLQSVVVAELSQHRPRGLVPASLDEQGVQKKET